MQGIFTKVLSLWIPNKTDKGTVVTDVFEPNFTKLDQYAEATNQTLENLKNNKLEKGTYNGKASDLNDEISKVASPTQLGRIKVGNNLKIDEDGFLSGQDVDLSNYYDKPEIEEKFKNFCPFPINSLFLTLGTENPATLFLGTTWQKQEGRFLLGSSGSYPLGSTGGSVTTTLTKANLPAEKLQLDSFSLGRGTQEIKGNFFLKGGSGSGHSATGAFYIGASGVGFQHGQEGSNYDPVIEFQASKSWTGMSTSAAPFTTNMGSGTAFNNMPPYLVVNIWKRLT